MTLMLAWESSHKVQKKTLISLKAMSHLRPSKSRIKKCCTSNTDSLHKVHAMKIAFSECNEPVVLVKVKGC